MQIKLKILLGKDPEHLIPFERDGELFEEKGVRLFLCKPSLTSPDWRVFCAKTGLGFSNLSRNKDDAIMSAAIKFRVYSRERILQCIEEGCKEDGFINEEALRGITTLRVTDNSEE